MGKPLDDFCGTPYWNSTLAWDVPTPDLTPCFENTALVWAPCLFLWIFTPLELQYIYKSKRKHIPWGWRSISKLVVIAALVVLAGIDLGKAIGDNVNGIKVYGASYFTPAFKILSFILAAVLLHYNRVVGLRSSGLLTIFWFFSMLLAIPRYRSELLQELYERPEAEKLQLPFIVYLIYMPLTVCMFILTCIADAEPTEWEYSKSMYPSPEQESSFLSRIFFTWFDSMAWKGFRRPLENKDLFDLNEQETCAGVIPLFDKYWANSLKKTERPEKSSEKTKKITVSVFPALCKSFGPTFIFAALMEICGNLLTFVSPQILKRLIAFSVTEEPLWKGFVYALVLVACSLTQTLLLSQFNIRMSCVGIRVRAALTSAIYRKALTISSSAKKESTAGEIVNLMAVDAQRFLDLGGYITLLWSAPIQIILAIYFLWDTLGVAVMAGLASMILLIPINGLIAMKIKNLQVAQLKNKDDRVKLMNEILNGIKVLKLYAWEMPFAERVLGIRQKELGKLKEAAYLQAGISFAFAVAPFVVTLVSFTTYVLMDDANILTASKAFVALSLFNIMQFPLAFLPLVILLAVQAGVSIRRIDRFMNAEDLNPNNVTHDSNEDSPLLIENGRFAWGEDEPCILKDVNFRVDRRKLVAVVGAVGSGKSSLLSALLGELDKLGGRVNTTGSIAYVPQQAWIQNATVKDNIIFGRPLDNTFYHRVVNSCALESDLAILTAGDLTEIGEKGINLSGGQKQRVSIARAVYNDADVYLFDDPLSAVDSHVGKHIFENVIGPRGLLRNKTRVLVTHGISFLKDVDLVVVLKDGEVSESGSYKELLQRKGAFAEFLMQHLQESAEEAEASEDLSELKAELEKTVGSAELQRHLSHTSGHSNGSDSTRQSIKRLNSRSSLRRRGSKTSQKSEAEVKDDNEDKLILDETLETGSVKFQVYITFLKSLGKFAAIGTFVMNVIYQGFSVGASLWLSKWTDDPDMNNAAAPNFIDKRNMYLGVYGGFGFGQALFSMVASFIFSLGCIAASGNLHQRMFHRTLRCPMSFFDTTPIGRILNRFSKDIDVIDNVLPTLIRQTLSLLFGVVGILFVISYSTPIFLAVIIPIGVVYFFVQRFYVSTSRQLKRLEAVSRSPIYSHFSETITGAPSIRAFGESKRFIVEAHRRVDVNQQCYYPVAVANRWSAVRLESIGNLIVFFSSLFTVLGRGSIAPGIVGLSVSYALQVTQSLNYLVRFSADVENNIVSVERLKEYGETPQEAEWADTDETVDESWPNEGTVEFRNYEVRYREGLDLVLKGINFSVKGGEKVGIVGRTGAGKSSLTIGLFRIVEAAGGQILIDGVDIAKLGLQTVRSRITIIPQDPVLFSGTLRLNVDPYARFSDEQLWRAMESAHLKALVKSFPAGLDHEISEGGENLSVGQRQLVCLARALLRKTKVLIFDEATAAVDLETDDLIQNTIRIDFKECTILTIAHRLNTIIDSDRVLVLDQGKIKEYEPPQDLLRRKDTIFYSLAKDAGLV